ncbi:MAG: alpha/beta hydrolase [Candidatus Eremiobacteraeota bacterium]|nr:alpha/beta hydrolase [Candidatus Eremiobacteraeota bacterium]
MNARLLLVCACVLTLACAWIVIPPPTLPAVVAADLAIEWSPWLFAAGLLLLLLLARARAPNRTRAAALVLACADIVISALPVLFIPSDRRQAIFGPGAHARSFQVYENPLTVAFEGRRLRLLEFFPLGAPACRPIVFALYGGAWQRGSPDKDANLNRALAARGYDVFALDYRHAPAFAFPAALHDVTEEMRIVRSIVTRDAKCTPRVALIGHSSGGELALLAAYAPGSKVDAVVSYSGPLDLARAYASPPHPDPIDARSVMQAYIGSPPESAPQAYRAASPRSFVRPGLPPTLLIYGGRDHIVQIEHARDFRDASKATGDDVSLVELPWAEHAFEEVPAGLHGRVALAAVEAFFGRTLPLTKSP